MSGKVKKKIYIVIGVGLLIAGSKIGNYLNSEKKQGSTTSEFGENYTVFSLDIPKDINFAGDLVPINNFEVRERLDRELLGNSFSRSQTILFHKRANRWFPVLAPILKRNGIPEDFKYVALIESELTNPTSKAGAKGFWQFIETTAVNYGLEINENIDERLNLEKSTEAACKYFAAAYKILNNWTLVAASYNMGVNGLYARLKVQDINNYYELHLNKETARYLYKILAIKEIISRPEHYGFKIKKSDLYPFIPVNKYEVDTSINNLADFAFKLKHDYNTLKIFNPWLLQSNLINKEHKKYIIQLPKVSIDHYKFLLTGAQEIILKTKDSNHVTLAKHVSDTNKEDHTSNNHPKY